MVRNTFINFLETPKYLFPWCMEINADSLLPIKKTLHHYSTIGQSKDKKSPVTISEKSQKLHK